MIKKYFDKTLLFLFLCCLFSCATYQSKFVRENYKEDSQNKEIDRRFYLIGDAGGSNNSEPSDALKLFRKAVSKSTKNDFAIFLGDNIYPDGMPPEDGANRENAEYQLTTQINAVKDVAAKVIFIPGNHDWYNGGVKGIERQEDFIEGIIKRKRVLLPSDVCGLDEIEISEAVHLITIDSQWFLEDWDKHPTINDDCEIKTRKKFFIEFEGMLKKNEGKTIIVAVHHPLFTYGTHGGYFAAGKQLFPFQSKVPMPGIASLIEHVRKSGGVSIQDTQNQRYQEFKKRIESIAIEAPANVIFASGHDHSLQYIVNNKIKQVIAGSGSKESATKLTGNAIFGSGKQGYAIIDVYKDGSSWVRFFTAVDSKEMLAFQTEVYPPTPAIKNYNFPKNYPSYITTSVYPKEKTEVSNTYKGFWGDHYREIYGTSIKAKVAVLDTLYGGLTPIRMGGGHQTKTLRLVDKRGKEYNMRAVKKSAVQFLQSVVLKDKILTTEDLTQTLPEDLLLDFYTSAHPYAAYPIPILSNAVGVYHTNPKLYYIPKQQRLGKYNDEYGDELYLIEERPGKEHQDLESFGRPDDIESTDDLFDNLREDEKYTLDERAYIRARLFDMLIGDWDRHTDQWRWAEFNEGNKKIYRPIPRDRDQAFSDFDGAFLSSVRTLVAPAKMMQRYEPELKNIEWFNTEPMPMDRVLIQNSTLPVWQEEAAYIQENLTDDVIEKAFKQVPREVQDQSLEKIKTTLKERKVLLGNIANNYYKTLNKVAVLFGTDKDDYIEVIRAKNKETHVVISRIKDGKKADVIVDRIFNSNITKEIWIYGLDDKDIFEVSGKAKNPIMVRLVGGQNNDTFKINNGKKVRFYDYKSKNNTVAVNNGGVKRFTDIYENNIFTYNKNKYSTYTLVPGLGFNPDAGVIAGLNYTITNYGFERNPFSTKHSFGARYHFATQGVEFTYDGEVAGLLKKLNLSFGAKYNSPTYARNFYGYGNETENLEDDLGMDYYRTNLSNLKGYLGLTKRSPYGSTFRGTFIFEGAQVDDTPDRFIGEYNLDDDFFNWKYFTTLELGYTYKSYDLGINPSRGMFFNAITGYTFNLSDSGHGFVYLKPQLTFYNRLSKDHKLVLKTNVQSQLNFGDDFEFYQAPFLGGNSGLRGYRINRFTGKNSLVFNGDVRYTFNSFKTRILPIQLGLYGGADCGRVWLENDDSGLWHNSFGGGVFIVASKLINMDMSLFNSKEGNRFALKLGVNF
ncbi:metallophosphoesterase [Galbibacter pacificus]|uniref:Metallophosphoesterase n=1 Tax=Galbibacter pacificus TaxID=2996052 RepID=A0ABT6FPL0_9FLAO|nr:metallophosphoesterase [Galbibacter pacificus]MDG3582317.1 metallophosphoesterase [Galbibacter pacificus]MDG3585207.1 metallophosphoesterase [Galbibacter pacificus]